MLTPNNKRVKSKCEPPSCFSFFSVCCCELCIAIIRQIKMMSANGWATTHYLSLNLDPLGTFSQLSPPAMSKSCPAAMHWFRPDRLQNSLWCSLQIHFQRKRVNFCDSKWLNRPCKPSVLLLSQSIDVFKHQYILPNMKAYPHEPICFHYDVINYPTK